MSSVNLRKIERILVANYAKEEIYEKKNILGA